ncbi:hypothetical protein BN136_3981 [Cronobacter universalis NCTC 9529]|nr:hypothetical protein BN136_3981 [Cronobacter universalis NCTC 9529]
MKYKIPKSIDPAPGANVPGTIFCAMNTARNRIKQQAVAARL